MTQATIMQTSLEDSSMTTCTGTVVSSVHGLGYITAKFQSEHTARGRRLSEE